MKIPEKVINHPNAYKIEENIYAIKNFVLPEESQWILSIAEATTEEEWFKDGRDWWSGKIIYIGEQNENNPHVKNLLARIENLFSESDHTIGGIKTIHRMKKKQIMFIHADNPKEINGLDNLVEFGIVMYHSDFEGGEVFYEDLGIEYKPEQYDLVIHPGSAKYKHGVRAVKSDTPRYITTAFVYGPGYEEILKSDAVYLDAETGKVNSEIHNPITVYHK